MESSRLRKELSQDANKYDQELNTVEEETKNNVKEAETQGESTYNEEVKGEENKDIVLEQMTSNDLKEQISNIINLLFNCAQIGEVMKKQEEEKVLEKIRLIKRSILIKIFKGKEYEIFTKRLINANEIINKIGTFISNLKCWATDCENKAKFMYAGENTDQIYCNSHRSVVKHSNETIIFENEFKNWKFDLYALEK